MIGITWGTYLVKRSAGAGENLLKYQELLARAELTPVLITPGTGTSLLSRLDGLMVPGGPDIEPSRYGAAPDAHLEDVSPELDEIEIEFVLAARALSMPMLGICRGQQLLNVAFGGTLHQHISHPLWGSDPSEEMHRVDVLPATRLHHFLGVDQLHVNSGHHQAIDRLAPPFVVSALSADGFIEGMEATDILVMAVQWHPEEMAEADSTARLMAGFADWVS